MSNLTPERIKQIGDMYASWPPCSGCGHHKWAHAAGVECRIVSMEGEFCRCKKYSLTKKKVETATVGTVGRTITTVNIALMIIVVAVLVTFVVYSL